MRPNPRIVAPIVLLAAVVGGAFWYLTRPTTAQSGILTASGTIEPCAASPNRRINWVVTRIANRATKTPAAAWVNSRRVAR